MVVEWNGVERASMGHLAKHGLDPQVPLLRLDPVFDLTLPHCHLIVCVCVCVSVFVCLYGCVLFCEEPHLLSLPRIIAKS